jgi:hypothetical protein
MAIVVPAGLAAAQAGNGRLFGASGVERATIPWPLDDDHAPTVRSQLAVICRWDAVLRGQAGLLSGWPEDHVLSVPLP